LVSAVPEAESRRKKEVARNRALARGETSEKMEQAMDPERPEPGSTDKSAPKKTGVRDMVELNVRRSDDVKKQSRVEVLLQFVVPEKKRP
jgi:hypothetical protein